LILCNQTTDAGAVIPKDGQQNEKLNQAQVGIKKQKNTFIHTVAI